MQDQKQNQKNRRLKEKSKAKATTLPLTRTSRLIEAAEAVSRINDLRAVDMLDSSALAASTKYSG
jgi:hypothetical protein